MLLYSVGTMAREDRILKILEELQQSHERLEKSYERLEQGQERLEQGQERLEKRVDNGQSHTETAFDALKSEIEDVQKKQKEHTAIIKTLATKADVERLEKEVDNLKKRLHPQRAD